MRLEPVGVVDQQRPGVASPLAEVQEALELGADARQVGRQLLVGEQGPLLGLAARVADHAGPAAGHGDGPVPGQLQAPQVADLEQVADVQAVGGRIEAAVGGQPVGVQPRSRASGSVSWWIRPRKRRSSTRWATASACHVDRPTGPVTSTATIGVTVAAPVRTPDPPDRARQHPMPNPYLQGNFAPVLEERSDDHELPVTGVIPPDLDGRLLRNGPNPALSRPTRPTTTGSAATGWSTPSPWPAARPPATAIAGCGPAPWPPSWRRHRPRGARPSRSTARPTPTSSDTPAPPLPWSSPASPTPSRPISTGPGSTTSTAPWPHR